MREKRPRRKARERIPEIGPLLENVNLSFNDIGRKLGISREYVRLIAKKHLSTTGTDRYKLREAQKTFPLTKTLRKIKSAAVERHLTFEPDYLFYKNRSFTARIYLKKRSCRINGRLCSIRAGHWTFNRQRNKYYLQLPGINGETEFCIITSPFGFFVVPKRHYWTKTRSITVNKTDTEGSGPRVSLKYEKYFEAWHLLNSLEKK